MSEDPKAEPVPAPCEPEAKPCCKCAAYREINQAQAQKIMRMQQAIDKIKEWMPVLDRYCKDAEKS